MSQFIPYGKQEISEEDRQAVLEVLHSDFLTQGPKVPLFEEAFAEYCGVGYAVAMNSATSALHTACLALGLSSGDKLWTTPITFVASANCALYCGAEVDFVDINPKTYNISTEALEEKLKQAELSDQLPKIIVPVHLCGQSCDIEKIHELSKQYGFKIIEDASHAVGGKYQDRPVGDCRYSDITVFSFHPVKIITSAEGGMALTNSKELADQMTLYRCHGVTHNPTTMTENHGPWYYQQITLGYNYRMNDLQAALGLSQLKRLDEFVECRHERAQRYSELLKDLPVILPYQIPSSHSSYHLYPIRLKLNEITRTHLQVFEFLRDKEIGVNLHYIPVHLQPYYQNLGFSPGDYPEAEKYYSESISLPLFPRLSDKLQDRVVDILKEALK